MKYNIIGDFHARKEALNLFDSDYINIFLGDYFDPYFLCSFEYIKELFLKILKLKEQHPETVLLLGNHDLTYLMDCDRTNRTDGKHFLEIRKLLTDNLDKFQIAYNIDNKYLCTHAGVGIMWYLKYIYNIPAQSFYDLSTFIKDKEEALKQVKQNWCYSTTSAVENDVIYYNNKFYFYKDTEFIPIDINIETLCEDLNTRLMNDFRNFSFSDHCQGFDSYGTSVTQGPTWIRPETLERVNVFRGTDIKQIVGHTQFKHIIKSDEIIYCDCLQYNLESYKIDCSENFI